MVVQFWLTRIILCRVLFTWVMIMFDFIFGMCCVAIILLIPVAIFTAFLASCGDNKKGRF